MTQNAHTPGPWYVDLDPYAGGDSVVFARNGHGHPVYIARVYRVMGDAQRNADARLIAAAPALLAALESLTQYHDAYGPAGMDTDDAEAFFNKARAALAAARGEG